MKTSGRTLMLLFLSVLLSVRCVFPAGAVTISEFLAVNDSVLQDEDGNYSDWIELHNEAAVAIDLDGWFLTDDADHLTKWPIPAVTIPPNGYLVVFASGENRRDVASALHTNFKLSGAGEYLALVRPDGETIEHAYAPVYPRQEADISYGLTSGESTTTALVPSGAVCRAAVPLDDTWGTNWLDRGFDDLGWSAGTLGVGFDRMNDYAPLIGLDLENAMYGANATAFVRVPFVVADAADVAVLTLVMRFDDGFAAYLNGHRVASANAPALLEWNAAATNSRLDAEAIVPLAFPVAAPAALLVDGTNILAIHGLNFALDGTDFLVFPELNAVNVSSNEAGLLRHFAVPSPGAPNQNSFAGFVADTTFSVDRGFFTNAFQVAVTSMTAGATIRYTRDGSWPTESHGTIAAGPITIANTTVLRAAAFKHGYVPSDVDTQTYIFLADVVDQPSAPAGFPVSWGSRSADYEMDPEIVTDPRYAADVTNALRDLPTLSLVVDTDDLFDAASGIYANPTGTGLAWERAASIELIHPDGEKGFQVNCGVRIQGGASRYPGTNKKHAFRLLFKSDYGAASLKHNLFGSLASDTFNTLVLRAGYNDVWGNNGSALRGKYLYVRDSFMRDSQAALGQQPASHGTFMHLYVNGLYWGVYNPSERPDAAFNADYLGGEPEEYDVHKHVFEVQNGTREAWDEMIAIAQDGVSSPAAYAAIGEYMDIDSLIDYMMLGLWAGSRDWLPNNWYAARRRQEGARFLFYAWDMEFSLRDYSEWSVGGPVRSSYLDKSDANCAAYLYHRLRDNPDFVQRFGDRVYKHLHNDGAMTPSNTMARLQALGDTVETALIAESARWGDAFVATPRTVDDDWRPHMDTLLNDYLVGRRESFIADLRGAGTLLAPLYPALDAPAMSHDGGHVGAALDLTMSSPTGVIYYTTDGSDPRLPGGAISPLALAYDPQRTIAIAPGTPLRLHVPTDGAAGDAWTRVAFDESGWRHATLPVGFDVGDGGVPVLVHYALDETTGTTAEDGSTNGWDGTYVNGVGLGQSGASSRTGLAASFDGTDDYVDLTSHLDHVRDLSRGTLTAWFRTTGTSTHAILAASDSGDASHELRLFVESGRLRYHVRGDSGSTANLESGSGVNNGQWRFAAVTVDANGMARLYLDGEEVAGGTRPFFSAVNGLDRMAMGRNVDSGGAQWHFNGELDDVRMYDTALAAEQVAQLFNNGEGGELVGPLADLVDPAQGGDLAAAMVGSNASLYSRMPFALDAGAPVRVSLNLRCEDGFVAYLNGVEVARRNAPGGVAWDSSAATDRDVFAALTRETIDLSAFRDVFVTPGSNVLALQVLNSHVASPDLFADVQLTIDRGVLALHENRQIKARVLAGDEWSPLVDPLFTFDHTSPLRISEMMVAPYVPRGSETNVSVRTSDFEFIELHNTGETAQGLAGYRLTGGVAFDFTGGSVAHIPPGGYVVVVNDLAAFTSRYPGVAGMAVAGEYQGDLNDSGETVALAADGIGEILAVAYGDGRGWPLRAQGAGHALVPLADADQPSRALDHGGNWRASTFRGGSPGAVDPDPPPGPRLNEVAAHTDYANAQRPEYDSNDWVELYNTSRSAVSLGDWYLSDDRDVLRKWAVPGRLVLASLGWIVFEEVGGFHDPITSGFGLSKAGEELYLSYLPGTSQDRVADALRFKGQDNGWTLGRHPDGSGEWVRLEPTPGSANGSMPGHVVIAEVMYHPLPSLASPEADARHEYIALHNPLGVAVVLQETAGPWRVAGEVAFTFPSNTVLAAGGHALVVSFDPADTTNRASFLERYGLAAGGVALYGPYAGRLSNHGGRLALERPQEPDDPGEFVSWIIVDEVFYFDRGPWPLTPDGAGMALHRVDPIQAATLPSSWRAGLPSPTGLGIEQEMLRLRISRLLSDNYALEWDALPGVSYRVETSDTLLTPVWVGQGSVASSNGIGRFSGTVPDEAGGRFFRVSRPQ